jgi:hypothetical protein
MSIEGGTTIVLAYLLVSIGVIAAFVGAAADNSERFRSPPTQSIACD